MARSVATRDGEPLFNFGVSERDTQNDRHLSRRRVRVHRLAAPYAQRLKLVGRIVIVARVEIRLRHAGRPLPGPLLNLFDRNVLSTFPEEATPQLLQLAV